MATTGKALILAVYSTFLPSMVLLGCKTGDYVRREPLVQAETAEINIYLRQRLESKHVMRFVFDRYQTLDKLFREHGELPDDWLAICDECNLNSLSDSVGDKGSPAEQWPEFLGTVSDPEARSRFLSWAKEFLSKEEEMIAKSFRLGRPVSLYFDQRNPSGPGAPTVEEMKQFLSALGVKNVIVANQYPSKPGTRCLAVSCILKTETTSSAGYVHRKDVVLPNDPQAEPGYKVLGGAPRRGAIIWVEKSKPSGSVSFELYLWGLSKHGISGECNRNHEVQLDLADLKRIAFANLLDHLRRIYGEDEVRRIEKTLH